MSKNCNEFTFKGWGSQISTTLDSVTERGDWREFFWVQTVMFVGC